ncbi:MAG: hypothetical protein M3083_19200 [Actinomycetota bacterium]|nr:hypothetical protein [Actinomycetota bacterium]
MTTALAESTTQRRLPEPFLAAATASTEHAAEASKKPTTANNANRSAPAFGNVM